MVLTALFTSGTAHVVPTYRSKSSRDPVHSGLGSSPRRSALPSRLFCLTSAPHVKTLRKLGDRGLRMLRRTGSVSQSSVASFLSDVREKGAPSCRPTWTCTSHV